MPSSTVETGKMWKRPLATASRTLSLEHEVAHVGLGDEHPLVALEPEGLAQTAKKPSIFSLTPPMAWTWPRWLTEPVTAKRCWMGTPESDDRRAYSSAEEALSPSTPGVGLLEDQASAQRQGAVGGVLGPQVPREDQHSLGVDGAAHLDFALDVHHFAVAQAVRGGDPAGPAEHVVTDRRHRKAVDLADDRAAGVHHDGRVG